MYKIVFSFLLLLTIVACSKEESMDKLDLDSYGIPITILAPDSTDVIVKDLVVMKDVVIRQGDGSKFNIQLYMSDATDSDAKTVTIDAKKDTEKDIYFSEMIKSEDHGFIFKSRIDTSTINYGFKYVRIEDGKEYVFQNGLYGSFDLAQIEKMYKAVQPVEE